MSGIIFFKTAHLKETTDFYMERIGMDIWLDQGNCIILKHDNLLLGFCQSDKADTESIITFFYDKKDDVDRMSKILKAGEPVENEQYKIYHFYSKDNEGRVIEFQTFLHPLKNI